MKRIAQWWAVVAVVVIFADAVMQLGSRGIATVRAGLEPVEWAVLVVLVLAFWYGEGVRALQRRWVPHVVVRIRMLPYAPLLYQLLAPVFALSLMGAPRREVVRAWLGVLLIVLAVVIVSRFPDPWRGITDLAVATALAWGLGAIVHQSRLAFGFFSG